MITTMLASSSVAPSVQNILIGPGSVVNLENLAAEIRAVGPLLSGKWLILHPQAAILRPEHAMAEKALITIGSTMKGTAEAAISKMRRGTSATAKQLQLMVREHLEGVLDEFDVMFSMEEKMYDKSIDVSSRMIVEGAQGFSLGIHGPFYPYGTSRDISTAQLFADCRIPFPTQGERVVNIGCCRTYPIRVANRFNDKGEMVGTSGGHYPDQDELTWEAIGRPVELTTVTKLPRRVFSFSNLQVAEAARVMGTTEIALTFCDYIAPRPGEDQGLPRAVTAFSERIRRATGIMPSLFSFGPDRADVIARTGSVALGD
jgi:adenylosuccinate synthase